MADTLPLHRSALPYPTTAVRGGTVHLTPRPEGHVLMATAAPGAAPSTADIARLGDGGAHAVRPVGPGQWLVVGDAPLAPDEVADRAGRLGGAVRLFDLGHGRVRIAVEGPGAAELLSTGVAVDLDPAVFPVGAAAACLFRHVAIHLCRTGPEAYEIVVARSFAADLWHALGG